MTSLPPRPAARWAVRIVCAAALLLVLAVLVRELVLRPGTEGIRAPAPPAPSAPVALPLDAERPVVEPSATPEERAAREELTHAAARKAPRTVGIVGRVLDGDREIPLEGVDLELTDALFDPRTRSSMLVLRFRSGPDGSFATEPVPISVYDLVARREGFATESLELPLYMVPSSAAPQARFSAGDVCMRRGTQAEFLVLDELELPVAGVPLYLFEGGRNGVSERMRSLGATDAHGLCAVRERIVLRSQGTTVAAIGPDGIGVCSLASGDRTAEERHFELRLERGGEFLVEVRDNAGKPIEGAMVSARPSFQPFASLFRAWHPLDLSGRGDDGALSSRFRAKTGADGRARLHGLPFGTGGPGRSAYRLAATAPNFESGGQDDQPLDGGVPVVRTLVLEPNVPLAVPLARVTGSVRSEDGSRLPEITVSCGGRCTLADPATGKYSLENFDFSDTEDFGVHARGAGWASDPGPLPKFSGDVVVDLVLFRCGAIRGTVLDAAGRPLAGVRVQASATDPNAPPGAAFARASPEVTLDDGHFEFSSLRTGEYELRATFASSQSWSSFRELRFAPLLVRTGGSEVRLVAERDKAVKGTLHADVLDARIGAALDISAAALTLASPSAEVSPPPPESFRIRLGAVDVPRLPVGRWRLWVIATSGAVGRGEFETTEAAPSAAIELRLDPSARLSGRLLSAPGTEDPGSWTGAFVDATRRESIPDPGGSVFSARLPDHVRCDVRADGTFEFPVLAPTRYSLQAILGDYAGTREVELTGKESVTVEIRMRVIEFATIVLDGPTDLFDGLTMLRWTEGESAPKEFPLEPDETLGSRCTMGVTAGQQHLQAWRRASAQDASAPSSFFFDESFGLKADETRTFTLQRPR